MDLLSTSSLFQQFLDQRRYLNNATPSTIEWYRDGVQSDAARSCATNDPPLTRTALQQFVVNLRQRDVKPVSRNTYIKAMSSAEHPRDVFSRLGTRC
jgi:hypothetical protein